MAGTLAEFVRNMKKPTFVLMCGSSRKGSHNAKLLESVRSRLAAEDAACEVVDLDALQLPIYSQDLETASMPRAAVELKEKLVAATGFVIACPEYNGMPTPLLLNAITWATRGEGGMYAGFQNNGALVDARSAGKVDALCGQLMHFARFQANRDKDDCIVRLINEQKVVGEYGSTE
ncbi:FMN reductase [Aureococcus anophagefferens]|nr:FMN reductase [Aureococcus anophagefferens]